MGLMVGAGEGAKADLKLGATVSDLFFSRRLTTRRFEVCQQKEQRKEMILIQYH